jgi:hypothetical protein
MDKPEDPKAKAVYDAASAIYFADSSDYLSALWCVVQALNPELAQLLQEKPRDAWAKAYKDFYGEEPT